MSGVNVYRDGFVYVRAEACDRCLLGADRLVGGARARELVASARDGEAGSFVCHRSQVTDEPEAICARWYEEFGEENWVFRLARLAGVIRRV